MQVDKRTLSKLNKLAEQSGVVVELKPNGHVILKGRLMVSYYPFSKGKTAYVQRTTKGFKGVTPEEAIRMTLEPPKFNGKKDKRRKYKAERKRLHNRGINNCHWCNDPITLENSTLEHIIPLGLGGLDNRNNYTLACKDCNEKRGNKMPELQENNHE